MSKALETLGGLLKWGSTVFAAIPGIAVFADGLEVPPNTRPFFGTVQVTVGVFVLLWLLLWHRDIRTWPRRKLVRRAGIYFATFIITLISYFSTYHHCVKSSTKDYWKPYGPVYYPLWLNKGTVEPGEQQGRQGIAEHVERQGRQGLVDDRGPVSTREKLETMPGLATARITTTALLLVLFVVSSTTLAISFALFGFYLTPTEPDPVLPASPPPPPPPAVTSELQGAQQVLADVRAANDPELLGGQPDGPA